MRKAPGALLTAFLVGLVVGYFVVQARDGDLMEYLSRQLNDYKQAFPGKSPNEAAREVGSLRKSHEETQSRLIALEKQVQEQHSQRHLTDEQKRVILTEIKQIPEPLPPIYVAALQDTEAIQYAIEFIRLFDANNIKTIASYYGKGKEYPYPNILQAQGPCKAGVVLAATDEKRPPKSEKRFYVVLWKAQIWTQFVSFIDGAPSDITMVICSKS